MMLPDMDGLEVLRKLRSSAPDVPVLFLTARDAVEDRIAGLTAGGDDYVTKPFSLEEVVARLRGLLRRTAQAARSDDTVLRVGDLVGRRAVVCAVMAMATPMAVYQFQVRQLDRQLMSAGDRTAATLNRPPRGGDDGGAFAAPPGQGPGTVSAHYRNGEFDW